MTSTIIHNTVSSTTWVDDRLTIIHNTISSTTWVDDRLTIIHNTVSSTTWVDDRSTIIHNTVSSTTRVDDRSTINAKAFRNERSWHSANVPAGHRIRYILNMSLQQNYYCINPFRGRMLL
jgi:carbonic anhydrase/acetyltransferase-like protein (isoleucine patch superfamily)